MKYEFLADESVVATVEAGSLEEATRKAMEIAQDGPQVNGWPVLLANVTDVRCDGKSARKAGLE